MKRFLILAVIVGLVAAFGITSVVLAQNPDPTNPAPGQGFGRMGRGMMGGSASDQDYGPMHTYMQAELAEALGITVDELNAAHADGKTFWQIAEEKGFTVEQAQQLMLDARSVALDAMVADGTITQEQADWMQQRGGMMGGGRGRGYGPGGCHGGSGAPGGMMGGGRWSQDG